jgi:hypothetical protein
MGAAYVENEDALRCGARRSAVGGTFTAGADAEDAGTRGVFALDIITWSTFTAGADA